MQSSPPDARLFCRPGPWLLLGLSLALHAALLAVGPKWYWTASATLRGWLAAEAAIVPPAPAAPVPLPAVAPAGARGPASPAGDENVLSMARGEGESERKKVERPPVAKKRVFPEYPSIARRAGLEGRVVARVLVDERGRVARLDRIEGHAVFREAVEAAARQWEFAPAMQGELAVSAWIAIPFVFRLE